MTTAAPSIERAFELVMGTSGGTTTTSVEPQAVIRWCPTKKLIESLKERDALADAMLLIVVVHRTPNDYYDPAHNTEDDQYYYEETKRYVVPFTAEMETVFFSFPGTNLIHATVVLPKDTPGRTKRLVLASRSGLRYDERIIDWQRGELMTDYDIGREFDMEFFGQVETREIEVDASFFPERPKGWRLKLLRMWGQESTFDECDTRGRLLRILPQTVFFLPFAYLIKLVGGLIAAIPLLRGIDWSQLWKPLEYESVRQMFRRADDPAWFYRRRKDSYHAAEPRHTVFWVFNPYTVFGGGAVLYLLARLLVNQTGAESALPWLDMGYWQAILFTLAIHAGVGMCIAIQRVWAKWFTRSGIAKRKRDRKERAHKERLSRELAAYQAMQCSPTELEADYGLLDTSTKRFSVRWRLRRSQIKATKACRPYSRINV